MLPTRSPYLSINGLDGDPLDDGSIYYGVANANPLTAPIPIFWDPDGLEPASQPLKTRNGYQVHAGTPANVYTSVAYSMSVYDKRGQLVYHAPDSSRSDGSTGGASAWVTFDGAAVSPSPYGSLNVSGITKNGTGDYTINFANPGPAFGYAVQININGAGFPVIFSLSAGSVRIQTKNPAEALADFGYVSVVCFRNS